MLALYAGLLPHSLTLHIANTNFLQCRKPTADELWISRYHGAQSYKPTDTKDIMRSVVTLQTMRNQLSALDNPPLAEKLMVLHFDYMMLMCLNAATPGKKNIQDEIEHRFPDYAEQFESMARELRRVRLSTAGPSSPSTVDETIPTATRDMINSMVVDPKNVSGNDKIAGWADAKKCIRNAVFLGEALPHLTDIGYGWKGFLLYGPPGTGKTQLAMSIAAEGKCKVFHVMCSSIVDKYLGASERNVRAHFKIAQENTPSVIFIDEVDALFSVRETRSAEASTQRLKSEFLSALTMCTKTVVIGATNLPWALDPAFLRRFDRHIHVGLPDLAERVEIFKIKLSICLHALTDSDFEELAESSDGFTGNTIREAVAQEWNAMYEKIESATHFRTASLNGREVYCPCPDGHPEARTVSFGSISDRLYPEPITKAGLLSAMESLQRTAAMAKAGEEKHLRWTHEMFQEL